MSDVAAVVPAAGHSQRMGRPKLILPVGGVSVIARVVTALRGAGLSRVVVVPPPTGAPGESILSRDAAEAGAVLAVPDAQPIDMRASVEIALSILERLGPPPTTVLLTPADSPGLTADLVASVIGRARAAPHSIIVPTVAGRRGHPVALPWEVAVSIRGLPAGVGVNAVIALHGSSVVEVEVDDPAAVSDLDTPEDYLRWEGDEPV
jgi:molybdenum cofactor cytidylyltransferase